MKYVTAVFGLLWSVATMPWFTTAGDLPLIIDESSSITRPSADFRQDWSHLGS